MSAPYSYARTTFVLLIALAMLEAAWELWLAPLRSKGSWLALKAIPLVILAFIILRNNIAGYQWLALLLPFYAAEALVRASTERSSRSVICASAALSLAILCFLACLAHVRTASRRRRADLKR